jgi:hypothetical protein
MPPPPRALILLLITVSRVRPCDPPTVADYELRAYPVAISYAPRRAVPVVGVALDASAAVSLHGGAASWTQLSVSSLVVTGTLPASPPDFLAQPAVPASFALASAPLFLSAEVWAFPRGAGGGGALARGVPAPGGGGWLLHCKGATVALAGADDTVRAAWGAWEAASVAGAPGSGAPAPLALALDAVELTWTLQGAPVNARAHAFAQGIDMSGVAPNGTVDSLLPGGGRHEFVARAQPGAARHVVPANTLRAGYLYSVSVTLRVGAPRWGFSSATAPWPAPAGLPPPASDCVNVSGSARGAPPPPLPGAGPAWVYAHVPPLGGALLLSPREGVALATPFSVTTAGWGAWLSDGVLLTPALGARAAAAALLAGAPLGPACVAALSGSGGSGGGCDTDCAPPTDGKTLPAHGAAQAEAARALGISASSLCARLAAAAGAVGGTLSGGGDDAALPLPPPAFAGSLRFDGAPGGVGGFWGGLNPDPATGIAPVGQVLYGDTGDGRSAAALVSRASFVDLPGDALPGCVLSPLARAPHGDVLSPAGGLLLPPPAGANATAAGRGVIAMVVEDSDGERGVALVEVALRAPPAATDGELAALFGTFTECSGGVAGDWGGQLACAGGAAAALAAGGAPAAATPFAPSLAAALLAGAAGALGGLAVGAPPPLAADASPFRAAATAIATLESLPIPPPALASCGAPCSVARRLAVDSLAASIRALGDAAAAAADGAAASGEAALLGGLAPAAPAPTAAAALAALGAILRTSVLTAAGGAQLAGASGQAAPAGGGGFADDVQLRSFLSTAAAAAALPLLPSYDLIDGGVAVELLSAGTDAAAIDRTPGRMRPYCGPALASLALRLPAAGSGGPPANESASFDSPLNPCVPAAALASVTVPAVALRAQLGARVTLPPHAVAALRNGTPPDAAFLDVLVVQFGYSPVDEARGHGTAVFGALPPALGEGANASTATEGVLLGVAATGAAPPRLRERAHRALAPAGNATPPLAPPLNAVAAAAQLLQPPPATARDLAPNRGLDSRPVFAAVRCASSAGRPLGVPATAPAAPPFFIALPFRDVSLADFSSSAWRINAAAWGLPRWAFNLTCPTPAAGAALRRNGTYPSTSFLLRGGGGGGGGGGGVLTLVNATRVTFRSPLRYVNSPASGGASTDALSAVVGEGALATVERDFAVESGVAYTFSAPCGAPLGPQLFVCGPGAEGAAVTFACPAAEAVPVCVAWGAGGWAPAPNCSVVELSGTSATCSCAADALPLLLALRFAALPRPGANVFAAVMPIVAPRSASLEPLFFVLLVVLLGGGALFILVGLALDARGRSAFLKRFLATPEGATLNALVAVTQKGGGEMLVDRFQPPARRSNRVHPLGRAAGEGGGGGGWALRAGSKKQTFSTTEKTPERRRARVISRIRSRRSSSCSSGGGGSFSGSSSTSSDEKGGFEDGGEDAEHRPEAAILQASHELETFGLSSLFAPALSRFAPPPPFPPPTFHAVAADAVRVIGVEPGGVPSPAELGAALRALPPRIVLAHPLAVALPWLVALAAAGSPLFAWLWRFSTRLPRPTRVLMVLVAALLSLTVVAYSAVLLLHKRTWYSLPAPGVVSSVALGGIAAGVAAGASVLLELAAARWVEDEVFGARYSHLALELRRRRLVDAALTVLPSAEVFACLTVSAGGDVIKKALAAAAGGGAFSVAPELVAALAAERFWDGNKVPLAAAAPVLAPAPVPAPHAVCPPDGRRVHSQPPPPGRKHASASGGRERGPHAPPSSVTGTLFHVYEQQALTMALAAAGGAHAGAGGAVASVSEDNGITIEGLSAEARGALTKLTLAARAALRHQCAPGFAELSKPPSALGGGGGGGCAHALFVVALLTLLAWCACALTVFGLWVPGGALWGCVNAWLAGAAVALLGGEPLRRALPLVNHLRHPPNPNHLLSVFSQLPAPLAPALQHAIATAEAAASVGPLALGGGDSARNRPAVLAAALPPALLEQSFSFTQAARPLAAWARMRQRAVAKIYLLAMLPVFGDAARSTALALASSAWAPAAAVTPAAAAPAPPPSPHSPPPRPSPPPPPPDSAVWAEALDAATGRPYWYNRVTRATQWHPPQGFSV